MAEVSKKHIIFHRGAETGVVVVVIRGVVLIEVDVVIILVTVAARNEA